MVTVQKLIEWLQEQNPNDIVIMAKDNEGNNYSPLDEISQDVYLQTESWYGELFIRELTPGLRTQGYTEEDLCYRPSDGQNCITLWPVN